MFRQSRAHKGPLTPHVRRALALPAVAVLAFSFLSGCATAATPEAFCAVLREDSERMQANYQAAGKDLGGQFGVLANNLSDYTRMVHRLKEIAPNEISADMAAASDAWDGQLEQLTRAASDPLGAVFGTLIAGLMADASMTRVDQYAVQQCGQSVFGSPDAVNPSASPTTSSAPSTPTTDTNAAVVLPTWRIPAVHVTDREGYTFDFSEIDIQVSEPISSDITNAPPGKADINPGVLEGSVTVTNTTSGRNAYAPRVMIIGYTPVKTPDECANLVESMSSDYGFRIGSNIWCAAQGWSYTSTPLGPGESKTLYWQIRLNAGKYGPLPEGQADDVTAQENSRKWVWVLEPRSPKEPEVEGGTKLKYLEVQAAFPQGGGDLYWGREDNEYTIILGKSGSFS